MLGKILGIHFTSIVGDAVRYLVCGTNGKFGVSTVVGGQRKGERIDHPQG